MIENLSAIKQYIVWPAQRNGLTTIYVKLYALNFQNQKYMYKKKQYQNVSWAVSNHWS